MDHAQWLGDTLEEVAGEKAGILKAGVPAVSAPQESTAEQVLKSRAAEVSAPLHFVSRIVEMPVNLRGSQQLRNAALAIEALHAARIAVSQEAVRAGLATVQWPGRFQEIDRFVLDGAHNPHGSAQLVETWREAFGDERALVIFGALRDKDYSGMLAALAPVAAEFWFVPVDSARGESPETLAGNCSYPKRVFTNLPEAIEATRNQPSRVLVTGSLFLVGEALEILV
jgi:dihydrofolate synthase/folylpolyglutamate synthase